MSLEKQGELGKIEARLKALGVAAGVFAQLNDGGKGLPELKEVVEYIFKAASLEPIND
jgi:hypothetical protein